MVGSYKDSCYGCTIDQAWGSISCDCQDGAPTHHGEIPADDSTTLDFSGCPKSYGYVSVIDDLMVLVMNLLMIKRFIGMDSWRLCPNTHHLCVLLNAFIQVVSIWNKNGLLTCAT